MIHLENLLFVGKLYSVYKREDLPYESIPQFSLRDKAYQSSDPSLRPFYRYTPELSSFDQLIKERSTFKTNRSVLVEVLTDQYKNIDNCDKTRSNIKKLNADNCFTIVTAHQPSMLTGPLYYIYKICSVIKLAEQLNNRYKDVEIVPVFVIGGEDHDFEEIASVHLFNKTFTWETKQKGAVGRMDLDGLKDVIDEVQSTFGQLPHAAELIEIIHNSLKLSNSYAQFAFRLTHALFAQYGLVIVNMDRAELKKIFLPIALKELKENFAHKLVEEDQHGLDSAGFKAQAFAREVNLFLHESDRERIIEQDDHTYNVGESKYSLPELQDYITNHPYKISPNVVLRPVMQELILPNLAYIGGGGEIAYWMERISLFKHLGIPFPMLVRRDSVMIVDSKSHDTLQKSNIEITAMFDREEQIINHYAIQQSTNDIHLDAIKERISAAFNEVLQLSDKVDPTLSKSVLAEESKAIKSLEYIENKLLKAEKRKSETEINKISKIKHKLFPNNDSLQERYENFIPYYLKYGPNWIDSLIKHLDPMDKSFKILIEEN